MKTPAKIDSVVESERPVSRARLVVVQGNEEKVRQRVSSFPPAILKHQSGTRIRVLQMLGNPADLGEEVDPEAEIDSWLTYHADLKDLKEQDAVVNLGKLVVPVLNPLSEDIVDQAMQFSRNGLYHLSSEELDFPEEVVTVVQLDIRDKIRTMWKKRYVRSWWTSENLAVLVYGQLDAGIRFMDKELFDSAIEQLLSGQVNVKLEIDSKELCVKIAKAYPDINFGQLIERAPRSSNPPKSKPPKSTR